jgi:hypothetical protein
MPFPATGTHLSDEPIMFSFTLRAKRSHLFKFILQRPLKQRAETRPATLNYCVHMKQISELPNQMQNTTYPKKT